MHNSSSTKIAAELAAMVRGACCDPFCSATSRETDETCWQCKKFVHYVQCAFNEDGTRFQYEPGQAEYRALCVHCVKAPQPAALAGPKPGRVTVAKPVVPVPGKAIAGPGAPQSRTGSRVVAAAAASPRSLVACHGAGAAGPRGGSSAGGGSGVLAGGGSHGGAHGRASAGPGGRNTSRGEGKRIVIPGSRFQDAAAVKDVEVALKERKAPSAVSHALLCVPPPSPLRVPTHTHP